MFQSTIACVPAPFSALIVNDETLLQDHDAKSILLLLYFNTNWYTNDETGLCSWSEHPESSLSNLVNIMGICIELWSGRLLHPAGRAGLYF